MSDTTRKPVAWLVLDADGAVWDVFLDADAARSCALDGECVPLYRDPPQPTLTTTREPVLWTLDFDGDPLHPDFVFASSADAENYQRHAKSKCPIVPLYRDPPPSNLTDAEREFLKLHRERLVWWAHSSKESAAELETVNGLLARLGGDK